MSTQTIAQWVAAQLAAWGVKAVYGVPGDAILPLLAAFEAHPGLQFYSVNHEATAAFMASAYAKYTGELGVCVATSGPGIANLLNGLPVVPPRHPAGPSARTLSQHQAPIQSGGDRRGLAPIEPG